MLLNNSLFWLHIVQTCIYTFDSVNKVIVNSVHSVIIAWIRLPVINC